MTEEKRNRFVAAITVNVIILIAILAVVCIYQIVELVTLNNLKKDLNEKLEYYQTETDKNEKTLEYLKSEEGKLDKAYEFGFVSGK